MLNTDPLGLCVSQGEGDDSDCAAGAETTSQDNQEQDKKRKVDYKGFTVSDQTVKGGLQAIANTLGADVEVTGGDRSAKQKGVTGLRMQSKPLGKRCCFFDSRLPSL